MASHCFQSESASLSPVDSFNPVLIFINSPFIRFSFCALSCQNTDRQVNGKQPQERNRCFLGWCSISDDYWYNYLPQKMEQWYSIAQSGITITRITISSGTLWRAQHWKINLQHLSALVVMITKIVVSFADCFCENTWEKRQIGSLQFQLKAGVENEKASLASWKKLISCSCRANTAEDQAQGLTVKPPQL